MPPSELSLYVKGGTFLHRLDPRSKLIMVLVSILYPAFFNNPLFTGAYFFLLIGFCIIGNLGVKRLLLVAYTSVVFLLSSLMLWPIYIKEGNLLMRINLPWGGIYKVTDLGLLYALNNMFRIVIPVIAMILFVSVTKPSHIMQMFDKLGLSYKSGMAFTIALRFIPVMFYEAMQVIEAQSARGQELRRGNLIKRARNLIPIFIPLLIRMLRIAIVTSMSLESRAFGASRKRTYIDEIKFTERDYLFSGIMISILFMAIILRIFNIGRLPISFA